MLGWPEPDPVELKNRQLNCLASSARTPLAQRNHPFHWTKLSGFRDLPCLNLRNTIWQLTLDVKLQMHLFPANVMTIWILTE